MNTNFDNCNINKTCQLTTSSTESENFEVLCCREAASLDPAFMNEFWIMTEECESKIFSYLWYKILHQYQLHGLELRDVAMSVWSPVFSQCEKLLVELKDYSISLTTVDQLFRGQPVSSITANIEQLYKGVRKCKKSMEVEDFKWIKGVVERINQYWLLSGYDDAAQAFLKIRDAFNLTGDFQLVENMSSQVRCRSAPAIWCIQSSLPHAPLVPVFSPCMQTTRSTLQDINQEMVTAAKFLEDYAKDEKKRECLRACAESKKIVEWIHMETKGDQ